MTLDQLHEYYLIIEKSSDPMFVFLKIAVISLFLFLGFRFLLTGNLLRMLKKIDKYVYRKVQRLYLHHAWMVWLFFMSAVILLALLTFKSGMLLVYASFEIWLMIVGFILFIGIFYYLYCILYAVIEVLRQYVEAEK